MSGKSGKGIASSLSKAFNTLKPQLKQFSSELSTTAKQIGAQQLQATSTAYLQKYAPQTPTALMIPQAPTAPKPAVMPTSTQAPLVENIVRASQISSASVAPVAITPTSSVAVATPPVSPPAVIQPEIIPGVSLKPGVVAETVMPTKSGKVTHAILKDITPKPFYKRTWFIVTLILVILLIMFAAAITIFLTVRNRDKNKQDEQ